MMNDTVLLLTGAGVFSLMLIGIAFTVAEFHRLRKRDERRRSKRRARDR